jgi:chemotaxis protein histidine kinase CheA
VSDDARRPSIEEVLAAARADFVALARAAMGRVEALATHADATDAAQALEAVRQEFHRIQGSAGTFGFGRLTRQAAAAQLLMRRWRGEVEAGAPSPPRAPLVLRLVAAMRREIDAGAGAPAAENRRVVLDDLDDGVATDVTLAATAAGLVVERAFKGELSEAMADGEPLAVVRAADVAAGGVDALVASIAARAAG